MMRKTIFLILAIALATNQKPKISPLVPANVEAERALLGSFILQPESYKELGEQLERGDFYSESNRLIFDGIKKLDGQIDLVSLAEAMQKAGTIEKAGGVSYLASLMDGIPFGTTAAARNYAKIVHENATLRDIINVAESIKCVASEGLDESQDIMEMGLYKFQTLAVQRGTVWDEGSTYRDSARSLLKSLKNPGRIRVLADFQELDDITGGFLGSELVLYTAATGIGKSLFAAQTRRRACRDGFHTLLASTEMSKEHIMARELAVPANVRRHKMRHPERLDADDFHRLGLAAEEQCERCRIVDGEISLGRIKSTARRLRSREGISLAVVDYDELVEVEGANDLERQVNLSKGLKNLAKELEIPIIEVSQLRKEQPIEAGRRKAPPTLDRIYGSGAKAKHASVVIYIEREYVRTLDPKIPETKAGIAVLKNRDGRLGYLEAYFNVETLRYESVTHEPVRTQPNP